MDLLERQGEWSRNRELYFLLKPHKVSDFPFGRWVYPRGRGRDAAEKNSKSCFKYRRKMIALGFGIPKERRGR
jgi:hypothetical protein